MKNNNKLNKIYISLAMLMIFGISFISAFAVSAPYMPDKQLILPQNSGATDLQFILQNGGGATDNITVKVNILNGSDIATLTDASDIYTVVPGAQIPVNIRINIPSNATVGNSYNVRLEFVTASAGESGQFGFGTGQEQAFTVMVGEKVAPEKQSSKSLLYIILGILIVLVVIVLILIKRKK